GRASPRRSPMQIDNRFFAQDRPLPGYGRAGDISNFDRAPPRCSQMNEPVAGKLRRKKRRSAKLLAAIVATYVAVSYVVLPAFWTRKEHDPELSKRAMVTANAQGIPGDPINVGLIGS